MVAELKRLEKLVFDDKERLDDAWMFKPGPDVQYQMTLEYLAELCLFIEKKYNKEIVHAMDSEIEGFDEEESTSTIEVQKNGITKLEVDAIVIRLFVSLSPARVDISRSTRKTKVPGREASLKSLKRGWGKLSSESFPQKN